MKLNNVKMIFDVGKTLLRSFWRFQDIFSSFSTNNSSIIQIASRIRR